MILIRHPLAMRLANLLDRFGLLRIVKYGMVGACAASTHAGMALLCHFLLGLPETASNFAGFLAGAVISYLGSYYFTFQSNEGHKRSLPRFALVWLIGIGINVGLFETLRQIFNIPFALNVLIAIVITPVCQYLMLRFWAFKNSV